MQVVPFVAVMLPDLSVAIMQVTVAVATMQLEVSAALIQVRVSSANMCVTMFVVIMLLPLVGRCYFRKCALHMTVSIVVMQVTVSVIAM